MKDLNLKAAGSLFLIANTPLFLIARLKSDVAAQTMASWESSDIFRFLRRSLSRRPSTLEKSVAPYVALAALALQQDAVGLKKAGRYEPRNHRWYKEICDFLIRSTQPTIYGRTDVIRAAVALNPTPPSSTPNTVGTYTVGHS